MNWFNRLPLFNREARVERIKHRLLRRLPRCTKRLTIIGQHTGDERYTCEITVEARDLAACFSSASNLIWHPDIHQQAAQVVLPQWLKNADEGGESVLPDVFWPLDQSHIAKLVDAGVAELRCPHCGTQFSAVKQQRLDQVSVMNWSFWTEQWLCPQGHELYREAFEMHIHRRAGNREAGKG